MQWDFGSKNGRSGLTLKHTKLVAVVTSVLTKRVNKCTYVPMAFQTLKKQKLTKYTIDNDRFAKGNFGEVISARDNLENHVVLKKLPKTADVRKEIEAGKRTSDCVYVAR